MSLGTTGNQRQSETYREFGGKAGISATPALVNHSMLHPAVNVNSSFIAYHSQFFDILTNNTGALNRSQHKNAMQRPLLQPLSDGLFVPEANSGRVLRVRTMLAWYRAVLIRGKGATWLLSTFARH